MATLIQTLPQTTSTMLHNRSGSTERYASSPSHHHHQASRSNQKFGSTSSTGYRGIPPSGPVAPYAFTSTPQLSNNVTPYRSHSSSPIMSTSQAPQLPQLNLSSTSLSNSTSSKSAPPSPSNNLPSFSKFGDESSQLSATANSVTKVTPERYRRNGRRTDTAESVSSKPYVSAPPSGSGMAAVGQLYSHPGQSSSSPSFHTNVVQSGTSHAYAQSKSAADDMQLGRQTPTEPASRYRRRSLGNIETAGLTHTSGDSNDNASPHPNVFVQPKKGDYVPVHAQVTQRPISTNRPHGSSENVNSGSSGRSSRPTSRNESHASASHPTYPSQPIHNTNQDVRPGSTTNRYIENGRRTPSGVNNPSPLSRPMSPNTDTEAIPDVASTSKTPVTTSPSPAAEHLAALNMKEAKKPKSKLRRAFSFGSSAELRKATVQANLEKTNAANVASKRISRHEEELDPESARIAAKQEAGGLGESIYSGQGNFFTGSTDNLSISSTASSASVMLRKMGKGMKKGGRSLVGLFRPKSVIGVPAADGPVNQASAAQVSMVTVEAEREKVNVNLDPHVHQGGGTGFPKLERNSLDNKMSLDSGSVSTENRSRRSIVGGERERAEILAAVKRGILKRTDSNQSSPSLRPADHRAPDLTLPSIPHVNDSPRSSAPSTPKDDLTNRRTDTVTINDHHDDYFGSDSRFTSLDSKTNVPLTPTRNISFSPRIQFYDTWPSAEYDRRGEIATCNRLTPMLAQQIKEELNTFKMEMEVHESSKIYTHFF